MALEAVNSAIEASQRIMQNLRPAILEQAWRQRCSGWWGASSAAPASRWLPGWPTTGKSCPRRALVAYRTAQEALTNVSKHAGATRIEMDLSLDSRRADAGDSRQRQGPER